MRQPILAALGVLLLVAAASTAQEPLAKADGIRPGVLPSTWRPAGPNCVGIPAFEVHEYNPDLVILRQSGCSHFEKPFLYMLFGAFPIVYQQLRGWSPGIGGLAFLGVAVGMIFAVAYAVFDNKRYARISDANKGFAPPEARLPLCMIGSVLVPIGMFWFAWTNDPSIHFMASISAGVP